MGLLGAVPKLFGFAFGMIGVCWMFLVGGWLVWNYDRLETTPSYQAHFLIFHKTFSVPGKFAPEYVVARAELQRQAEAVVQRQTASVARVDQSAAAADTEAQTKIQWRTQTLIKEVPQYVQTLVPGEPRPCVPWGIVRLHDAAVLHVDPASLQPPAGQLDAACSDVEVSAFMDGVIGNYGIADANAKQLDDLEADIAARGAAVGTR